MLRNAEPTSVNVSGPANGGLASVNPKISQNRLAKAADSVVMQSLAPTAAKAARKYGVLSAMRRVTPKVARKRVDF